MKRLAISLFLLCIHTTAAAQTSNAPPGETLCIGLSSHTVGRLNPNDYMASVKSWAALVGREKGLRIQARAEVFDVDDHFRSTGHLEQLDAYSLTVEDLMFLGLQPESIFLVHQGDGFYIHYALIVHRDSGITDLEGLRGSRMIIPEGHQMILARKWLTIMLADCAGAPGELIPGDNPSKSILQVFFRQAHATIVAQKTFELACELNPQLQMELRVLFVSPPLISGFFMFRPTFRGLIRQQLESAILGLHATPSGRQILAIFQSSCMEKHPASVLDTTRRFLTMYHQLVDETGQP